MKKHIGTKELPMKPVYRLLTILLIPLLFLHFWTSGVSPAYAAMPDEKVTIFTPESVESAPIEAVKPPTQPEKGISKWWYVLIVGAIAGGAAVAAGSGGGGGGGDSGSGGGSSTGTSTVTW